MPSENPAPKGRRKGIEQSLRHLNIPTQRSLQLVNQSRLHVSVIVRNVRRETALAIKAIAARVSLRTSKAANAKLHRHMQEGANLRKAKPRHAGRRT
jgi:hypothetical protein